MIVSDVASVVLVPSFFFGLVDNSFGFESFGLVDNSFGFESSVGGRLSVDGSLGLLYKNIMFQNCYLLRRSRLLQKWSLSWILPYDLNKT